MEFSFPVNITCFSRSNQALKKRIAILRRPVILTYMNNYEFERKIVEVLTELIESRGLKHEPTVEAAWPDKKDPGPAWQKIRNRVPPQKLSLRDAYGLARVLDMSMSALCGIVEGRAIEEQLNQRAGQPIRKKEAPCLQELEAGSTQPAANEVANRNQAIVKA